MMLFMQQLSGIYQQSNSAVSPRARKTQRDDAANAAASRRGDQRTKSRLMKELKILHGIKRSSSDAESDQAGDVDV